MKKLFLITIFTTFTLSAAEAEEQFNTVFAENFALLPQEIRDDIHRRIVQEKIVTGPSISNLDQLQAKSFTHLIGRYLIAYHMSDPAGTRRTVKRLIFTKQLIPFLNNIDINKLPRTLLSMIIEESKSSFTYKQEMRSMITGTTSKSSFRHSSEIFDILSRYLDNSTFAWLKKDPDFAIPSYAAHNLIEYNDKFDQIDLLDQELIEEISQHCQRRPTAIKNVGLLKKVIERFSRYDLQRFAEDTARQHSDPEIIEFLVRQKNIAPHDLVTIAALCNRNLGIIRTLKKLGADINYQPYAGATALHYAAQFGCPSKVQLLLQLGANPAVQNSLKETPLHCAVHAKHDSLAIMQQLICAGAPINSTDRDGNSPLMRVLQGEYFDCDRTAQQATSTKEKAILLLQHGASTQGIRDRIEKRYANWPVLRDDLLMILQEYAGKKTFQEDDLVQQYTKVIEDCRKSIDSYQAFIYGIEKRTITKQEINASYPDIARAMHFFKRSIKQYNRRLARIHASMHPKQ